jgi:predicted metal-dependent phosphoesterase TrpH
MRVDLHMHTTASDGCLSPEQIVAAVKAEGINLFAIADHDTTENVLETERHAHRAGLSFIRATEVSTNDGPLLCHVLSYGIDLNHRPLQDLLASTRQAFTDSQITSLRAIRDAGFSFDLAPFDTYKWDPSRGGWTALNFLIDQGVVTDVHDFFKRIAPLVRVKLWPACPPTVPTIRLIREAGGIPVLAHPGESLKRLDHADVLAKLTEYRDAGLCGIECFSPYHTPDKIIHWLSVTEKLGLLSTAGSDYHGDFTPERALGRPKAYASDLNLGKLASL